MRQNRLEDRPVSAGKIGRASLASDVPAEVSGLADRLTGVYVFDIEPAELTARHTAAAAVGLVLERRLNTDRDGDGEPSHARGHSAGTWEVSRLPRHHAETAEERENPPPEPIGLEKPDSSMVVTRLAPRGLSRPVELW